MNNILIAFICKRVGSKKLIKKRMKRQGQGLVSLENEKLNTIHKKQTIR